MSKDLHNFNCYQYLKNIAIVLNKYPTLYHKANYLTALYQAFYRNGQVIAYRSDFAYGNLYTRFFTQLEQTFDLLANNSGFVELIKAVYENDNKILETTYAEIKPVIWAQVPSSKSLQDEIKKQLPRSQINKITPQSAGSRWGRLSAMLSKNFKPQSVTSIPTIRHYQFHKGLNNYPMELRFGTQAQRHQGEEEISPIYDVYIGAHKREGVEPAAITHLYFNLLARNRTDFEGEREKKLTSQLELLEAKHSNLVVITLPADKGLMDKREVFELEKTLNARGIKDLMQQIACGDDISEHKYKTPFKDFYLSETAKKRLYGIKGRTFNKEAQQRTINNLLEASFNACGVLDNETTNINPAQRQAVWFYFTKYAFPKFIIDTLQPQVINFSCKDAIDRGGVASAFYNLMRSFETGSPLSRDEFEQALHAAAAVVKGRGLNHHHKLIWNAINAFVNKNFENLIIDKNKRWLILWRNMNTPHQRVNDVLDDFCDKSLQFFKDQDSSKQVETSKELVITINEHAKVASGKRLLLEAATRLVECHLKPNNQNIKAFSELSNKLTVSYPLLYKIAGLIKKLIGYLLFSNSLKTQGAATYYKGRFSHRANQLSSDLQLFFNDKKASAGNTDSLSKLDKKQPGNDQNLSA